MKIVLIIILSLFVSSCEKKEINNNDVLSKNTDLLVYESYEIDNLITLKEGITLENNDVFIPKKIGENKYTIKYKKDNKIKEKELIFNVVDNTPPKVFGGTNKTVLLNYDKDLCDLIVYGDNYDKKPKCEITGEYDLQKEGTYKLLYKLTDQSNNLKEVNVTLNIVKEYKKNNTPTEKKVTNFSEVYKEHKKENTEIGIDVSKWQGNIDFEKVASANASFVMIRIGVQTKQNGELSLDKYYLENIKKAKEAGLKVGVYLYSIATSEKEAIDHADWVVNELNGEALDLPITFDWENWSKWNSYNMSFYDINNIANSFIKRVEEKGYKGMLYSSKFYLENIWENKNNNTVWLAHYTTKTNYQDSYMIWQLCNNGKIDGINGNVDIDILYK